MNNRRKYFLVGIKGSGMAALAQILSDDGNDVKGVDLENEVFTEVSLTEHNIKIYSFNNVDDIDADFIVVGHNFMDHEFMSKVRASNIPFMEYHRFLNLYFRNKHQIAVAGTHGKTTTVGLLHCALNDYLNLSMLRGDGVGTGGNNPSVVYEACEYKDHFLVYNPSIIIVTNIDYDHSDYFLSVDEYNKSFDNFTKKAKKVIILKEDVNKINRKEGVITFGLNDDSDYYWKNLVLSEGIFGDVYYKDKLIGEIRLKNIFGLHNALHVLAVLALADQIGINLRQINERLANFTFIKRRMEHKIIGDDVFIDDYAHHPSEIKSSINIARLMYPRKRVVVIFKPDRFSRLKTFCESFKEALQSADQSYVLPLYEHISEEEIGSKILECNKIKYVDAIEDLESEKEFHQDTIYLFMSSKNLDKWIYDLEKYFHKTR